MNIHSYKDVPATPIGEILHNPSTDQVLNYAIGLQNPIDDIESLKSFFSNSIILTIPRLSSLLVSHPNGKHSWRKTHDFNIDDHFIIRLLISDETSDHEDLINGYLAELATAPQMSTEKPLWEVHVLVDVSCIVLRFHHVVGDGVSLTSLLREIGTAVEDQDKRDNSKKKGEMWRCSLKRDGFWGVCRYLGYSSVFLLQLGVKALVVKDGKSALKGEFRSCDRPHKIATARFNLDDVNLVRKAVPNSTVNDVLCGIIWGGFTKYIHARASSGDVLAAKEGQQITCALIANMRRVTGLQELATMEGRSLERFWGNNTGVFLLPMKYTKRDEEVMSYVRKCHSILDNKKHSAEPRLSTHLMKTLVRLFGVKVASWVFAKACKNATCAFSNVSGPSEKMMIAGNPVTYLKLSLSSSPMGIVMHLISYMKNLNLQILADSDIIPDPKLLAICFEKTFQQMKDALNEGSKGG